jgi:hypothetical protein
MTQQQKDDWMVYLNTTLRDYIKDTKTYINNAGPGSNPPTPPPPPPGV